MFTEFLLVILGFTHPSTLTEGKKIFFKLANELLDKQSASDYNQGIMEFDRNNVNQLIQIVAFALLQESCVAHQEKSVSNYL